MAPESRGRESHWEGREAGLGRRSHHGDGSKHRHFLLGDKGMGDRDACCGGFFPKFWLAAVWIGGN